MNSSWSDVLGRDQEKEKIFSWIFGLISGFYYSGIQAAQLILRFLVFRFDKK